LAKRNVEKFIDFAFVAAGPTPPGTLVARSSSHCPTQRRPKGVCQPLATEWLDATILSAPRLLCGYLKNIMTMVVSAVTPHKAIFEAASLQRQLCNVRQ